MKNFLQRYSYESVHLFLNQFAIGLFGTTLAFASKASGSVVLSIITTVFSILFLFFLQFLAMWKVGANDRVTFDLGKQKKNYLIPVYMWLLSSSVSIILAIIIGIISFFPEGSAISNVGVAINAVKLFIDGMYTWLLSLRINGVQLNSMWFMHLLTPLPVLPVIFFAYVLGFNNVTFSKKK